MFLSSKQSAKDRLFIYKQSRSRSVGERKTALMFFNVGEISSGILKKD